MFMNRKLLETCSEPVQKKLRKLGERYTDYDREEPLSFKDGDIFYALGQVESEAVKSYLSCYDESTFWNWDEFTDEPHRAWYVFRLLNEYAIDGWRQNEHITEIIEWFEDQQTIQGEFKWVEGEDHTSPLRLFVEARPNSPRTRKGIEYFLKNPPELYPAYNLPLGVSAVCDYDYHRYQERLKELASDLVDLQTDEGLFANRGSPATKTGYNQKVTSFAVEELMKVSGYDENIKEAVQWLESSSNRIHRLLGLLYSSQGPKVALRKHEWEMELMDQKMNRISPEFVQTAPLMGTKTHTTTLRNEVEAAIHSTERILKICSPYLDMLHEDIIDLSEADEAIEVKILTKPKGDVSGSRARLAKSAIEQLNRARNRSVRTNHIIHSRFIISDSDSLLVSSADLTRDQLVDEYNAGLTTGDEDAISDATEYFELLWDTSEPL